MTDMPETIWAVYHDTGYPEEGGEWLDGAASFYSGLSPVEYTRTDTIPQVKVKPLVWEEKVYDDKNKQFPYVRGVSYLSTSFGVNYEIASFEGQNGFALMINNKTIGGFSTFDNKKTASQAHHDAAILSAIEGDG